MPIARRARIRAPPETASSNSLWTRPVWSRAGAAAPGFRVPRTRANMRPSIPFSSMILEACATASPANARRRARPGGCRCRKVSWRDATASAGRATSCSKPPPIRKPFSANAAHRAEQAIGGDEPPQCQPAERHGGADHHGQQILRKLVLRRDLASGSSAKPPGRPPARRVRTAPQPSRAFRRPAHSCASPFQRSRSARAT